MKKYFVKETDELLEYGDIIQITLEKDLEDGYVGCEKEVEFVEGMEDFLLDLGIIEEREVEGEDEYSEEEDLEDAIRDLEEDMEALEDRIGAMEGLIGEMYDFLKAEVKSNTKTVKSNKIK